MKELLCSLAALAIFAGIVVLACVGAIFSDTPGPDNDDFDHE